jgi:hypothetical protein
MAQTGFTPIQLYFSSTTTNVPLAANLANGELAINITDGKLFYKDNASAVQVIGWKVVPATAGGTGQTSYAVGDLLYANTTTTLAKLPDVATGNALISGGVGVAPSYGKIGLTTHVSGTLPTANGGTNLSTFTANRIFYASSTSVMAQSSALNFDGTNFLVGTTSGGTGQIRSISVGSDGYAYGSLCTVNTSGNYWNIICAGSGASSNLYLGYNGNDRGYFDNSTGAYVPVSDSRLKKNIADISYGLQSVLALHPVAYNMIDQEDTAPKALGFIAQEAMQVISESVSEMQSGMYGMDKVALIPVLVKAIQEQQAIIESLKARLDAANL